MSKPIVSSVLLAAAASIVHVSPVAALPGGAPVGPPAFPEGVESIDDGVTTCSPAWFWFDGECRPLPEVGELAAPGARLIAAQTCQTSECNDVVLVELYPAETRLTLVLGLTTALGAYPDRAGYPEAASVRRDVSVNPFKEVLTDELSVRIGWTPLGVPRQTGRVTTQHFLDGTAQRETCVAGSCNSILIDGDLGTGPGLPTAPPPGGGTDDEPLQTCEELAAAVEQHQQGSCEATVLRFGSMALMMAALVDAHEQSISLAFDYENSVTTEILGGTPVGGGTSNGWRIMHELTLDPEFAPAVEIAVDWLTQTCQTPAETAYEQTRLSCELRQELIEAAQEAMEQAADQEYAVTGDPLDGNGGMEGWDDEDSWYTPGDYCTYELTAGAYVEGGGCHEDRQLCVGTWSVLGVCECEEYITLYSGPC